MNTATISSITLPLPHCWFDAETSLPKHRFRAARIPDGAAAMDQVVARVAGLSEDAIRGAEQDNTLNTSQRLFDSYFSVERADALPIPMLRRALADTLPATLADIKAGVSIDSKEQEVLAVGLHRLADWAQVPIEIDLTIAPVAPAQPNALNRWKQQHHLFFLIIHGMLHLLHVLEEALDKEHAPVVQAILEDFADLMDASAVAFRLAGDFSIEEYERDIRPDMLRHDPHFSGLFYADHKELVAGLRVLRRVPDDFDEEVNRIGDAISAVYDAHALVCLKFVGEGASLASNDESRVAAESIRGKYVKRTKVCAGVAAPRGV